MLNVFTQKREILLENFLVSQQGLLDFFLGHIFQEKCFAERIILKRKTYKFFL